MPKRSSNASARAFGQFFRADHHELQAAEVFGEAAARVRLQERGRREKKGDQVIADQLTDSGEIERAGVIGHADAEDGGKPQRYSEAEGMEERQHAEKHIAFASSMNVCPICSMLDMML